MLLLPCHTIQPRVVPSGIKDTGQSVQQSLFDGLDKSEVFPFLVEDLVISPEPILRLETSI